MLHLFVLDYLLECVPLPKRVGQNKSISLLGLWLTKIQNPGEREDRKTPSKMATTFYLLLSVLNYNYNFVPILLASPILFPI